MTPSIGPARATDQEPPFVAPTSSADRGVRPLTVAAVASLSAGAVHAAAIGAHAEHPRAAEMFTAVALFQLGWGALALARRGRAIALVGAIGHTALFGGWILAKSRGLSFVDGLEATEPIQFADGLCAVLAAVSASAAVTALLSSGSRLHVGPRQPLLFGGVAAVVAFSAIPGMVEAGKHAHAGSEPKTVVVVKGKAKVVTVNAAVPPKPYDPSKPIDLGGVAGVTEAQQARAENVVADTVLRLPQWSDPATAEAAGFKSIHDGVTGFEHFVNYSYVADDTILDPDHPESLVYRVRNGKRTLQSAMYMLKPGADLNAVPDIGGKLTQWHIHNNLCFTNTKGAPRVAGLTDGNGNCRAPLIKLPAVPMIHIWIVPQKCGPFSALEGIGAGQVKPGDEAICDHAHGATSGF